MICSKCGTPNPDYYVFCQKCFADLSEVGTPSGSASGQTRGPATAGQQPGDQSAPSSSYESPGVAYTPPPVTPTPPKSVGNPDEPYLREAPYQATGRARDPVQAPSYNAAARDNRSSYAPNDLPSVDDIVRETTPAYPEGSDRDRYEEYPEPTENNLSRREMKRMKKEAEREAKELQRLQQHQNNDYYDYYDYYDEAALKRERRRGRFVGVIFWLVLLALIAAAIWIAANIVNKNMGGVSNLFAMIVGNRPPVEVTAESDALTGRPQHKISVYAKKGEQVHFNDPEINKVMQVPQNQTTGYKLLDMYWIPVEPDPALETLEITPNMSIVDKDGKETVIEVPSFTVQVPQVSMNITQPATLTGVKVQDGKLTIAGTASTLYNDQFNIFIEGHEGVPTINENGQFTAEITVPPGDFSLEVKAVSPRYRANIATISGVSEITEITVAFDQPFNAPVDTDKATVSGKTVTGGNFSVTGEVSEQRYDAATGQFSFIASLPKPGRHEFVVKASKDTMSAEQPLVIIRTPPVNDFTSSAKKLVFADIVAAPEAAAASNYFFDGKITASSAEGPVKKITMLVDGKEESKVSINYYGVTNPEIGKNFRVYGSVTKVADDKSSIDMDAFFLYREEDLQGNQQ